MKVAIGTRSNPPRTKKNNAQTISPKPPKAVRAAHARPEVMKKAAAIGKKPKGARFVAAPESESDSEDELSFNSDDELSSDSSASDLSEELDESSDVDDTDDGDEDADVSEDAKPEVEEKKVLQALNALKKLAQASDAQRKVLFDDTKPIIMQIECIKIPKCTTRKLRFKLPHRLVTDTSEVCLFVADLKKGKRVDHEPTIEHYEDLLRQKGIKNIKTIMPVRQVRVEYDQLEMKRRLLTQYDFFLADAKISGLLAHKLGMTFFRKNRLPTPVKMGAKDLKAEIDQALHKTVMRLHGIGNTFALHVANGTHEVSEAYENVEAVLLQLAKQFPGGWANIRSVHLKNPLSIALPIYVTLKNKNLVKTTEIKPLVNYTKEVEGELTTILGATVKVFSNGKVSLKREKLSSDESESENEASPEKKVKVEIKEEPVTPDVIVKASSKKSKKKLNSEEAKPKQSNGTNEVDEKQNKSNGVDKITNQKSKKSKKGIPVEESVSSDLVDVVAKSEQKKKQKAVKQKVTQPVSPNITENKIQSKKNKKAKH